METSTLALFQPTDGWVSIVRGSTIQPGSKDLFRRYFLHPFQPASSTQLLRDNTRLSQTLHRTCCQYFVPSSETYTHACHFSVWGFFVYDFCLQIRSWSFYNSQGKQFEPLRPVTLRDLKHNFGTLQFHVCEVSVVMNIFLIGNNHLCSRIF